MAASDVDAAMTAAIAAFELGNYATALSKARVAKGWLSALADVRKGSSGFQLEWDRAAIDGFVEEVKAAAGEAGVSLGASRGLQRTKVTYVEVSE